MNQPGPLDVALSAHLPISDAPRIPEAVELLLTAHQRRTAADPVHDRLPAYRSGRATDRLLAILDSLPRAANHARGVA